MTNYPRKRQDWYLNPFSELENLQRQMNKLFDYSLYQPEYSDTSILGSQWVPAIDIYDSKDSIKVKVDLAGLKKEDIDVSIQENVLTIKGEKKRSSEVKEDAYLRTERFTGTFHRSITLPTEVDQEKVQASFRDGVLELVLPKKEEAKPKQIMNKGR